MSKKSKETARVLVRRVVDELEAKLANHRQAVMGAEPCRAQPSPQAQRDRLKRTIKNESQELSARLSHRDP